MLTLLLVVVTKLMAHVVQLQAQRLISLLAEDTVGDGAGAHAGWKHGEGFALAKFRLLIGLSQDCVGFGIEIGAGWEAELFLKVGIFLDAGVSSNPG